MCDTILFKMQELYCNNLEENRLLFIAAFMMQIVLEFVIKCY